MIDYLVVGLGLAGISFCERLEEHHKSFKVISDASQTSSLVAGGLYNPVILKRFTLAWKAKEQLDLANAFYTRLEHKLNIKLNYRLPVYRRFSSVEEQNLWFEASDKKDLSQFLSRKILTNENPNISAPYGLGEVLHTGRIDTQLLVSEYKKYLQKKELLAQDTFDHDKLKITERSVTYKSYEGRQIIFAEGFGLRDNPFFNYLPLNGNKGEYLFIKSSNLELRYALKSSIFCIPQGNDIYRVGANYDWNDKSNLVTEKAKKELLKKLDQFIRSPYEIVNQIAGIRPTVSDRKPLVGRHPDLGNLYVLNGFGSRGVMIAPFASGQLLNFIEKGDVLDPDTDISRFIEKYVRA